MLPKEDAYTTVMPWYEREDFPQLWEMADDRDGVSPDYDVWHQNARKVLHDLLARGRVLHLIRIRPGEYSDWLKATGRPNTAATRILYVEELAAGATPPRATQH